MTWRAEIALVDTDRWSHNLRTFQDYEEAEKFAVTLLRSWEGADLARVVPDETFPAMPVNMRDPQIVISFREG
jgi:hypothetical protein